MDNKNLLLKTALLAGRIMMESGSEVYRVEDTMQRIAQNSKKIGHGKLCDSDWDFHEY